MFENQASNPRFFIAKFKYKQVVLLFCKTKFENYKQTFNLISICSPEIRSFLQPLEVEIDEDNVNLGPKEVKT